MTHKLSELAVFWRIMLTLNGAVLGVVLTMLAASTQNWILALLLFLATVNAAIYSVFRIIQSA